LEILPPTKRITGGADLPDALLRVVDEFVDDEIGARADGEGRAVDEKHLHHASGLTAAATPTLSAAAGAMATASPSERPSRAAAPLNRAQGESRDEYIPVIPQNLFCTPISAMRSSYCLIS
jgi:hypothetical protein